jgi:hypothetical protein
MTDSYAFTAKKPGLSSGILHQAMVTTEYCSLASSAQCLQYLGGKQRYDFPGLLEQYYLMANLSVSY